MSETSESARGRKKTPGLARLLALAGLVAAVLVVAAFNRRLAASRSVLESRRVLETQVAGLEREGALLQTQVAYATTDAAVIEWAHTEGKLVQEGERLVVVVPGSTPQPAPTPVPPAPEPRSGNWQVWLVLFFDRAPAVPVSNP